MPCRQLCSGSRRTCRCPGRARAPLSCPTSLALSTGKRLLVQSNAANQTATKKALAGYSQRSCSQSQSRRHTHRTAVAVGMRIPKSMPSRMGTAIRLDTTASSMQH